VRLKEDDGRTTNSDARNVLQGTGSDPRASERAATTNAEVASWIDARDFTLLLLVILKPSLLL
jgi:hypothetical protein